VKLIAINENGIPAEPLGPLPQLARDVCDSFKQFYNSQGFTPPWTGYLAEQDGVIVGSCGFKGAPVNNRVEIAYFTFPEFEGRGLATQMARHLGLHSAGYLARGYSCGADATRGKRFNIYSEKAWVRI
jgi:[ribosomal protein S5]-alanine N-acetyltransferase